MSHSRTCDGTEEAIGSRTLPMTVYILFLMGMLTIVTAPVGVLIAHLASFRAPDWARSHYAFQVRTFWWGLPILAAGLTLAMNLIGYFLITAWVFWVIARCASGINMLMDNRAVPRPFSPWLGRARKKD